MHIRWFGHSCFSAEAAGRTVLVDPFDLRQARRQVITFAYPPVTGIRPDVVAVTHSHWDHNGLGPFEDLCPLVRNEGRHTIGGMRFHCVAADHDRVHGAERGQVLLISWTQGDWRLCHLGDVGQDSLTPEQEIAIGSPDVLFVPVGGGPTIDGPAAARIVRRIQPRHVVPMHYRTPAINFLHTVDAFLRAMESWAVVHRLSSPELSLTQGPPRARPKVYVLPAPYRAG